jgi:hypothetical protein
VRAIFKIEQSSCHRLWPEPLSIGPRRWFSKLSLARKRLVASALPGEPSPLLPPTRFWWTFPCRRVSRTASHAAPVAGVSCTSNAFHTIATPVFDRHSRHSLAGPSGIDSQSGLFRSKLIFKRIPRKFDGRIAPTWDRNMPCDGISPLWFKRGNPAVYFADYFWHKYNQRKNPTRNHRLVSCRFPAC